MEFKNKILILFSALALLSHEQVTSNTNTMGSDKKNIEIATFGGGCFWCTEAIYERIDGVISVASGYSGGESKHPTYEEVCSGLTGHAEVIQVKYDANKVSYIQLLEVFFKTHNPTTLNQQGADRGSQYRSIVLFHDELQRREANKIIELLEKEQVWSDPIVTEVEAFSKFYGAEEHHQGYYDDNKEKSYCNIVITPKLDKFEKAFSELLKK